MSARRRSGARLFLSGTLSSLVLAACLVAVDATEALAFSNLPTTVVPEPVLTVNKNAGTGEVVLTWTGTTGPYVTPRNTNPNFSGSPAAHILASGVVGTEFRDTVLNDGISYYYTIEDANTVPQIYSASTNSGVPGTAVTLTGAGFDPASPGDNEVLIGGTPASIISVSSTTLTYNTPPGLTGYVVVRNKNGRAVGQIHYVVATSGLNRISSLAVDTAHIPFVADTGDGIGPWDRVFTFVPSTGVQTQVGSLNEAAGLPTDNSNRVYYGNGVVSSANFGSIKRTSSAGGEAVFRTCGNSLSMPQDPCNVFGIAIDPSLTDFGIEGRVYVADGAAQKVRIVPSAALSVTDFATGLSFGSGPRGILVDRNSTSTLFRDVFVSDSTSVRRFNSATVPSPPAEKTYNSTNASLFSPRQMAITPFLPKERLVVADDALGRIVVIDPLTDKFKIIGIPLTSPRAIALDQDVNGVTFAYVGEATRVLKFPIHARTVYLAIWIADNVIQPLEVQRQVDVARAALEKCGIDLQVRSINGFSAGALLDLEVVDLRDQTKRCGNSAMLRTQNETDLLNAVGRRGADPTDLNIYYVRKFMVGGVSPPPYNNSGETVTADCFAGGISDQTNSGVIIDASAILMGQNRKNGVAVLLHEIGHALIDRTRWGVDEHNDQSNVAYTDSNVMNAAVSRDTLSFDANQCANIEQDVTNFRGDP